MVKVAVTYDTDGYITDYTTRLSGAETLEEVDENLLPNIIVGITKLQDGALLFRCAVSVDADGYVTGAGTDPTGDTDLPADELAALVPGATKLVGGHLVLDAAKLAEIEADMARPVPTEQDSINAALLKSMAQTQLANATLLKQMATMTTEVVNNG